jgi:hypothetical protein
MKVLFLDIDGVLNNWQQALRRKGINPTKALRKARELGLDHDGIADIRRMMKDLDPWNVENLKYITENVPDLQIVISSTWRKFFDLELFKIVFGSLGVRPIVGITPAKFSGTNRLHEVEMYMEDAGLVWEESIVLDDHEVLPAEHPFSDHMIQTDQFNGLTFSEALDIVEKLNPAFKRPLVLM